MGASFKNSLTILCMKLECGFCYHFLRGVFGASDENLIPVSYDESFRLHMKILLSLIRRGFDASSEISFTISNEFNFGHIHKLSFYFE